MSALVGAMRAIKQSPYGFFGLAGLSFLYGVFHAAGPGHGKAVITSYMISNERALRRGIIIAFLAAIFQAIVAIALVGLAAPGFQPDDGRADERGGPISRDVRRTQASSFSAWCCSAPTTALVRERSPCLGGDAHPGFRRASKRLPMSHARSGSGNFVADDGSAEIHGRHCGHFHAPIRRTRRRGLPGVRRDHDRDGGRPALLGARS